MRSKDRPKACPHDLHLGLDPSGSGPVLHCELRGGHDGTHAAQGLHWSTAHADETRRLAEAYAAGSTHEAVARRCRSCRWWTRNTLPTRRSSHGRCTHAAFEFAAGPGSPLRDDGVAYWDVELRGATFETGAEFGCVHFERDPARETERTTARAIDPSPDEDA